MTWIIRHDDDQEGVTYVRAWYIDYAVVATPAAEWTNRQALAHRFENRDVAMLLALSTGGEVKRLVKPRRTVREEGFDEALDRAIEVADTIEAECKNQDEVAGAARVYNALFRCREDIAEERRYRESPRTSQAGGDRRG